jgi:hypothetical protein
VDRRQERAFEEFVAESGDALLRLATLLTSDQGLGEDVYQETLHRLAARWSRVDNPRAYCRRVMLWEPDLSPALRSAVYKVLAATPGVRVKTGVTDTSGRPATEISRVNTVAHDDAETFLDPRTGGTLESAWAYPSGEFDADLYEKITYTNALPSDPYNG